MGSEISKGDAGRESPRSDSQTRTAASCDAGSPMGKSSQFARWFLGLAVFAWLAWVGFLIAMLMTQPGGLGSS